MQTYQLAIACSFIVATVLLALGGWYRKRQTVVMAAGALAALGLVVVTIVNALDSPNPNCDTPLPPKSDTPMQYNSNCTFTDFEEARSFYEHNIYLPIPEQFVKGHVENPLGELVDHKSDGSTSDACFLKTQEIMQNDDSTANFPNECRGYRLIMGGTGASDPEHRCSMAYLFGTAIGVSA